VTWYNHEKPSMQARWVNYCSILPAACGTSHSMREYLENRGLSFDIAVENGWYLSVAAGDSKQRIIIPATSKIPGNIYWQARAVQPLVEPRYQSPHAQRGDAVVVVWPTLRGHSHTTAGAVVEGPMDALAAAGAGCIGVALMGAMPPEAALALTSTILSGRMCYVVFDRDQPLPTTTRTLPYLLQHGVRAKLVDPYPAKDLAELTPEQRRELLQ